MPATTKKNAKTVVVALGGNAILQPGQVGTFEEQLFNIDGAMGRIAELVKDGWRVVLTHGNGPQVGNLLIQNALAAKTVAPMPMDVCGAMSQGEIGYMAAQTLANHLAKRKLEVPVVTVVTQVAVDAKDPAFAAPSKPVGPFYSEAEARKMMLEEGTAMREDAGRGWRRVVPSPEPMEIVELEAIRDLVDGGVLVVCSGGGGVPVVRSRGALSGIDAVIDKDLAAALLAAELGAEALLILTDVPQAYVHYNTPEQRALSTVSVAEMEGYAAEGHFKAGSMGPKVAACLRFARAGGDAVIASLTEVVPALQGTAGTRIVGAPGGKAKAAGSRTETAGAKTAGAKGSGAKAKKGAKSKTGGKSKAAGSAGSRKAAGAKKATGQKAKHSAGAQVIDIGVARRRASGGRS
jgi:carbamate kinase